MSTLFAKLEGIGELNLLKIYGFYEVPLMFTCQSRTGIKYLLLRLAADPAKWLAVEVNDSILLSLETGRIEMREPFVHPKNGFAYVISSETEPYCVHLISPELITEDMLPFAGEYLTESGESVEKTNHQMNFDDQFNVSKERSGLIWKNMKKAEKRWQPMESIRHNAGGEAA